ncbi:TPA: M20/M25/M40 family metallo-hydrolase [Streptococcus suis]
MAFLSEKEQIKKFWQDQIVQEDIDHLRFFISKKSIFAQQIGLEEAADFLKTLFEEAGAEVLVDKSYAAPFVLAKFTSPNPEAKTLIFYNHYDTVPADSDQIWLKGKPFELTITKDSMYGRGVDDDKGHIIARLSAVKKYLKKNGKLPVNILFVMEGAEESASVDLDKYLTKYKDQLYKADLLIWEQGIRNHQDQLVIAGGNKGIVTFDVAVKSAALDIHSSFGGVIESAAWYLVQALNSLRNVDGTITVPGIYDQVQQPNDRELALVEEFALQDEFGLREVYGLELPLLSNDRKELLRRLYFEPSINIEGLTSGYQGQGVKTILPAQASAKMEVRLVPGLTPEGVLKSIRKHFESNGFEKVEVTYTLGEESYRSDMSAPAILQLIDLAKDFYPKGVAVLPTSPGTGPMHTVFHALGVPIAGFGLGHEGSRDHAGDENIKIADYIAHVELVEELIGAYE